MRILECFVWLIWWQKKIQSNIELIVKYYKQNEIKNVSEKKEDILIKYIDTPEIKACYADLFTRWKLIAKKLKNEENTKSFSKILSVQYKSLDEKIKNQEINATLDSKIT